MSAPATISAKAVERLLHADIAVATRLIELLDEENDALISRDRQGLESLITEKQQLMEKLEFSSKQRSRWVQPLVASSGLPLEQCWEQVLQQLDDKALTASWEQFQQLVERCKQANERNGKLIARGRSTLRQLLSIFRGQYVEAPKLYTASGTTQSGNQSHTVTKA